MRYSSNTAVNTYHRLVLAIRFEGKKLRCALFFRPVSAKMKPGYIVRTGGTQMFNALIGPARTKYLVMTGARLDAETIQPLVDGDVQ